VATAQAGPRAVPGTTLAPAACGRRAGRIDALSPAPRIPLVLLAATVVAALPVPGEARHVQGNGLLRIVTPVAGTAAVAHPFVNVVVRFGRAEGADADPATFRARLGHTDVTGAFVPIVEGGQVVGVRAALGAPPVHVGRRAVNRLRLLVRSVRRGRGRRLRDVHRVHFHAVAGANTPPEPRLTASTDVISPGQAVAFDGTGSHDPDGDLLHYHWDFGDGASAEGPTASHVYPASADDRTVSLTVDDGQAAASGALTLLVRCMLPLGRTPGLLRVEAAQALEFGAVPVGGRAVLPLVVRNDGTDPESRVCVRLGTASGAFVPSPAAIDDLGPGQEARVELTFAPTVAGHQDTTLTVVGAAANRSAVHVLAHGFGGSAPGTGPTLAAEPLFTTEDFESMLAIMPSGARVSIDTSVPTCEDSGGGGTGDVCVAPADCVNPGETCTGDVTPVSPLDFCSDGEGGLYVLSDDGNFTPADGADEPSGTILRLQLAPDGTRTGAGIFTRINSETDEIACDRRPGAQGRVYVARYADLDPTDTCGRDGEETLGVYPHTGGAGQSNGRPIDLAVTGDQCNGDFDQIGDLEVSRDGRSAFASFTTAGGIYRIAGPSPTPLLIVPEVYDVFQIHPDGDVLYATVTDQGTRALLSLYRIAPDQALHGAVPLEAQTPCATFTLPGNGGVTRLGSLSIAAAPAADGSGDATVLVSVLGSEGPPPVAGQPPVLSRSLRVAGTVAFAAPAGNAPCTALGLVNLELLDPMAF
jgi:hypothetical protein